MTISNQAAHQVDDDVVPAAMAGALDLRDTCACAQCRCVLQLVKNGLDDGSLAQEQFVSQRE